MKTRMGVGRCCCAKKPMCPIGLTAWSDDFTEYTNGEIVPGYDYACEPPIKSNGGILGQTSVFCPLRSVTKPYPFDPRIHSAARFELETISTSGVVFIIGQRVDGVSGGNHMTDTPYIRYSSGVFGEILAVWYDANGDYQSQALATPASANDVFAMDYIIDDWSFPSSGRILVIATVSYQHNGSEFHSATSYTNLPESAWCARVFGHQEGGVTDNWEFNLI